ncbi:PEP-CTERM sorting domain-containing protein, partial [Candidatus Spyradosoma sp. SGI.093]|uniref:PEP-CTERM sorting domain-containing protein n=1 Tax=Candidatus Spyradosoma sp. SGI.093 TaxID=3420583 RepID=UPI003D01B391
VAAHANALGTTKGVEVQSGATLNLGTSAVTVAGLSGAGTVGLANGTDSSTLTVNGGGVFTGTLSGGTNSLALVFDADGQTLDLNPAVSNTLSSVDVRAGTVKTGSSFGLGYSQVSVQSPGTLEFTASKTNDYGLMLGGITFADGSSFVVDVTGAAENDVLKIITSSVIKFNTGSEDVSLTSDNLDLFVNDFVTLKGWDGLADWSYADNMLSVTLTIPEPSTFGLLAGLGALALAGTRRRRKKA